MECSRKYSWSLRHKPVGPLAPYIGGFIGRLSVLGYAETSAHQCTRLAADFSGWLKQKKVAKEEITGSRKIMPSDKDPPISPKPSSEHFSAAWRNHSA
jgi:hypothetical protein